MDSLITAAARALAAGDPLGALKRVALREDASALALRGIAMAQLGDHARARQLLRRAVRAFGQRETVARARCVVAEAEVALASRDLDSKAESLEGARATLLAHGDPINAAHAKYLEIRRLLLIGHLDVAENMLAELDSRALPPAWRAIHALVTAGIAVRRVRPGVARAALGQARRAASQARIPALSAEVDDAVRRLDSPVARLITHDGVQRLVLLDEVAALLGAEVFILDACRHVVRDARHVISLATRPVLFALALELATAAPLEVPRDVLVARAFGSKFMDETHRVRLRVEIGRLRKLLRPLASIRATRHGFVLAPCVAQPVAVLARLVDEKHAAVLAFLADGEAWSSSALALALGRSQRTVQRSLDALAAAGKVQCYGRARARRWMTPPMPGFATTLLLPAPLPID